MKLLLAILLFTSQAFGQKYAQWTSGKETYVKNYTLETSSDGSSYVPISTFTPLKKDTNTYSYTLPESVAWYRVKANMIIGNPFYSISILNAANSATIISATIKSRWFNDSLIWGISNEKNVSYYQIEKSTGGAWSSVTRVTSNGQPAYSYNVFRFLSKKPMYKVTVFYQDGSQGQQMIFK